MNKYEGYLRSDVLSGFHVTCLPHQQERGHCANITAKSTAVIWRLHVNALHLPVPCSKSEWDGEVNQCKSS